jgi:hypothetical protein
VRRRPFTSHFCTTFLQSPSTGGNNKTRDKSKLHFFVENKQLGKSLFRLLPFNKNKPIKINKSPFFKEK